VADVPSGLSLTPTQKVKKKKFVLMAQGVRVGTVCASWSRDVLERLIVAQLVKRFGTFYETPSVITETPDVMMAVIIKNTVIWDVTPCSLVNVKGQRFLTLSLLTSFYHQAAYSQTLVLTTSI
jgi:hypothetical protein